MEFIYVKRVFLQKLLKSLKIVFVKALSFDNLYVFFLRKVSELST